MKKTIKKILAIFTLMAISMAISYANKSEAPILVGFNDSVRVLPVDYITIHSIVVGKQNGDCKTTIEDIRFGKDDKKLGDKLSWLDESSISFKRSYGELCRPNSDENQNDKYIIVLTTNFGSYVYEFIYAEYEKAKKEKKKYILPLMEYKK